jgi:hypothetical protein
MGPLPTGVLYCHITVFFICQLLILRWDVSNTHLLLYPLGDIGMQLSQKRKALLYAGIGFVLIGVVSLVLTYMLLY